MSDSPAALVQKLYVAYFGRPADPAGLAYWTSVVQAQPANMAMVLNGFSTSAESAALYPDSTPAQLITAIYQNLFNRQPEPMGLAYWSHALETGLMSSAAAAFAIMQGALGSDAQALSNKLQAASTFFEQLDTPQEIAGYAGMDSAAIARAFLKTVGASSQSLADAANALQTAVKKATGLYTEPSPTPEPGPTDTQAPTIASVAITSASGVQNSTLNTGNVLSVTVTMSEATTVTGTPQLALNIGGTTVKAHYASGSGSTALVFNYTILAGQTDADGISIAANSLALNSGTLKDAAGNSASLSHSAVANNASYRVDSAAPIATLISPQSRMVQLEAMGNATGSDEYPQVSAVGSNGEFVVTWQGVDEGDNSIFVQKFDAQGQASGAMVPLEALDRSNGPDERPQITAVGSNGEFVVTWEGMDSDSEGGDISIYVQKFNAQGQASGAMVLLEAFGRATGADERPQVSALGSNGEFVVTWSGNDSDSGADYSIFVQKFNANGTTTGHTMEKLEATGNSGGKDQYPQVSALGSNGAFVVTWYGEEADGDYSIFVQKFNADGTTSGDPVKLEALGKTDGYDQNPQVSAVGSNGEFVVTWYGEEADGDNSIFVQKFNADGTTTGDLVKLEAKNLHYGTDQNPQVSAVGSNGEFVVTWEGVDSEGDNSIFVQKFDALGQPIPQPIQLSTLTPVDVRSSEVGTAYLVKSNIAVSTVSDITSALDAQWNGVAITAAHTNTAMPTTGLENGSYSLYTSDAAGNLSTAVVDVVIIGVV